MIFKRNKKKRGLSGKASYGDGKKITPQEPQKEVGGAGSRRPIGGLGGGGGSGIPMELPTKYTPTYNNPQGKVPAPKKHNTSGEECWCKPKVIKVPPNPQLTNK